MASIKSYFDKLIEETLPNADRREAAKNAPSGVREHLKQHELATLSPCTRLIGSYKRNTAVQELKDVDILVFVDQSEDDCTPAEALKLVRDALNDFPDSEADTRKQTRSVRIRIPRWDISLDIVPALNYNDGNLLPLRIPDTDANEWVDTNPLRFEEFLTDLSQQRDGRVKPLVRLFKVWRNECFVYKSPKSYWLETLTYSAVRAGISQPDIDGYARAFRDLLKYSVDTIAPYVDLGQVPVLLDPVLATDITGDWPLEYWESFLTKLRDGLELADKALAEEDDDAALHAWSRVFGSAWPETDEKSALYDAILTGAAAVSATGTVFATRPDSIRAQPVPASRAFGGEEAGD